MRLIRIVPPKPLPPQTGPGIPSMPVEPEPVFDPLAEQIWEPGLDLAVGEALLRWVRVRRAASPR